MKLSQFTKLIREEVRSLIQEGNLNTANLSLSNVQEKYKTLDPTVRGGKRYTAETPYPKFLEYLKTGELTKVISSTAKTIDIPLFDYTSGQQQSLTPYFKKIQQDLFAAGYKWINGGGQEVQKAGGRGGDLFLGINPKTKEIDMFRD